MKKEFLFNLMGGVIFILITLAPSCPSKSPDSYIEAGRKYFYEKKDYPKAYKFYTRAIKLNPVLYSAYWERAMVDIKIDSLEKAIDDMSVYIESNPRKDSLATALYQRAEILYKKGYKADACDDWNSCRQLNQSNANSASEQYRLHCK